MRKILRSLQKRFDIKVTTIKEAHDISSMKVDDLMGSLLTCEMSLNHISDKKNKGIALQSSIENHVTDGVEEFKDSLVDAIYLLSK